MNVSARVHYAAQAMVELAIRRADPSPVTIRDITDRHGVPGPFLTQILRTLRTAGWVQSIRGAQGGYRIAVDPESLTLLDIAKLLGDCNQTDACTADGTTSDAKLRDSWREATAAYEAALSSRTLAAIADEVRCGEAAMYFI